MFKTEDDYYLYFDGIISQAQEATFKKLIQEHQLDTEFLNLLKKHYNFVTEDSYSLHHMLLWILYKILGSYAITIMFAEVAPPHGCEYQARIDFCVEVNGSFDYELKNSIFLYTDSAQSEECKKRIEERSIGFDKDRRVKGSIGKMDMESFVNRIT